MLGQILALAVPLILVTCFATVPLAVLFEVFYWQFG